MKNMQVMIFIVGLIMTSCKSELINESDFYSTQKKLDLWRVPLVEPYEIVSPNNSNDWFLILKDPKISGPNFILHGAEFQYTNITQIGMIDSVIILENLDQYWPKLSGNYPSVLIINVKTQNCFIFSKEHHANEMQLKKEEFGLKGLQMYSWRKIKDDYQQQGKLPAEWKKYG